MTSTVPGPAAHCQHVGELPDPPGAGPGPAPVSVDLTTLARALRISAAERDHLFPLAGSAPPQPGRICGAVRPSVLRLMDRFTDLPAMLLNARADILAWNRMAAALLGDFSALPAAQRNIVWLRFAGACSGRLIAGRQERERLHRAAVAELRAAAARYPAALNQLKDLRVGAPAAARAAWRAQAACAGPRSRRRASNALKFICVQPPAAEPARELSWPDSAQAALWRTDW